MYCQIVGHIHTTNPRSKKLMLNVSPQHIPIISSTLLVQECSSFHGYSGGGHLVRDAAWTYPGGWSSWYGKNRCRCTNHLQSLPQLPRSKDTAGHSLQPGSQPGTAVQSIKSLDQKRIIKKNKFVQLFEKIMCLDIEERHLLRLGHGEEELATDKDFSRYGRVNFILALRMELLKEVERLQVSQSNISSLEINKDFGKFADILTI